MYSRPTLRAISASRNALILPSNVEINLHQSALPFQSDGGLHSVHIRSSEICRNERSVVCSRHARRMHHRRRRKIDATFTALRCRSPFLSRLTLSLHLLLHPPALPFHSVPLPLDLSPCGCAVTKRRVSASSASSTLTVPVPLIPLSTSAAYMSILSPMPYNASPAFPLFATAQMTHCSYISI